MNNLAAYGALFTICDKHLSCQFAHSTLNSQHTVPHHVRWSVRLLIATHRARRQAVGAICGVVRSAGLGGGALAAGWRAS